MRMESILIGLAVLAGAIVGAVGGLTGCAATGEGSGRAASGVESVTDPAVLPAVLADGSGVIVLDARDAESFRLSHLPGALNAPANDWNTAAREGAGLRDRAVWSRKIAALGIERDSRVLVYDAGTMTDAARVWFILQHAGVANASVLNGGLKAAAAQLASIPMQSGEARTVAASNFRMSGSAQPGVGLAEKDEMKTLVKGKKRVILDVRSADEYSGVAKGKNPRGGHLPGAVSLPHTELYNDQGMLKSRSDVATLLRSRGIEPGTPFTVHCQGGGRSSFVALAAAHAGFTDVENYHNSFGEWAADESCPIEP